MRKTRCRTKHIIDLFCPTLTHKSTILVEAFIELKGQVEKYIVIDTRLLTWATSCGWRESKSKGEKKKKEKMLYQNYLISIIYFIYSNFKIVYTCGY